MIHVYQENGGYWVARHDKYIAYGYDKYHAIGKLLWAMRHNNISISNLSEIVEL